MVQILAGPITYLLLAIYCHEHYQEKVSIRRVRELRIRIKNEALACEQATSPETVLPEDSELHSRAKT
jgi:hypothetical protein